MGWGGGGLYLPIPTTSEKERAALASRIRIDPPSQNMRHGGDVMQWEQVAITTRVANSFIRVGSFELYGRRAAAGDAIGLRQLEQLTKHALSREYGGYNDTAPLQGQILTMLVSTGRMLRLANPHPP